MRVAFNALFLQEPRTGTGRYVYNLLRSLGRVDGVTEYAVLSPREPEVMPETPSTFMWETVPLDRVRRGGENFEKLAWEQFAFPAAAKRLGARVMHVPHFAPPRYTHGIPTLVTIHDVVPLRLPEYRASAPAQLYSRLVSWAARHADMVVAVSEHAKADIIELLGIAPDRVRVVVEAPAPGYRPVQDPATLRAARAKYGLGDRYVLNVGGLDARKNIAGLIGAFAAVYHDIGDPDLQLFIAGEPKLLGTSPVFPDWRPLAAQFGIAAQVVCMPIGEHDLPALYSGAACFAFASLYEGFGLPPIEAMACGAPVVCSDRTSLPEVVGSSGLLADPTDVEAFGTAMMRVLTEPEYADDLRLRGLARAKQFTWDQVAVETSALYAELAGTRRD
ncbi:MAG TPA: glycosyltransferase family 1 protein [Ktedonobacterales bacterium]|nr:glycosyltransferase family 1 protein [Ktedonobacterales bacterium]